jgi:hypothetical protein
MKQVGQILKDGWMGWRVLKDGKAWRKGEKGWSRSKVWKLLRG